MAEFYITDCGIQQLLAEGFLELGDDTTLRHVPFINEEELKQLLQNKPCRA
jgi:hypothetical protein